ncbi:aldo/keto reductase [Chromohalobacter nigrandesensis]|uniref:aldo/keto reductase n=1 Tax=Chromohalobacter nigrandesensis TaxID=119863 RepID=UPI001FF3B7FA|nr:aldo/keto reductase [Chromohalobacter nigrandesensis]MCK0745259.1 aldo/keto reductase [Chromohalobacter nigrandesensis]
MENVTIPGTELAPSRVGLGTWAIGGWKWGGTDDANAIRTIHAALDRGITLIDTAPAYGFGQYLAAVEALAQLARERHDKPVLALAVRWVLDSHPNAIALWGARRPDQVTPLDALADWSLTASDLRDINAIIEAHVTDPVGPEFMAPPAREA